MNHVLKRILNTKTVTEGVTTYPLHSNIQPEEGEFIQSVIRSVKPSSSLEVGMAYGVSTLFICEALADLDAPVRHTVIDPSQTKVWHGVGLAHVREAGFDKFVQFFEEGSEIALPRLLSQGLEIDLAFIDGWHTFDHALVDFFYVNKMLRPGGVVIFDDVNYEAIHRLLRHILTYPAYKFFGTASTPSNQQRPSFVGRMRKAFGRSSLARKLLRPGLVDRPWDTGWSECVAVQKVEADRRSWEWWEEF